ncbi:YceI family protein [Gemmatimonadota bacterium]
MHRLKALYVAPLLLAMATTFPSSTSPGGFNFDMPHSYVGFSVKHMVIATVKGQFKDFTGNVIYDPDDLASSSVEASIVVSSVDTGNEARDNHLRSGDFFDVENNPNITFKSTRIEARDDHFVAIGDLTIRGVMKEVEMEFELLGPVDGMQGEQRYGANGWLEIDRRDFGVNWSKTLDNGGMVVSSMVKIEINMELVSQ